MTRARAKTRSGSQTPAGRPPARTKSRSRTVTQPRTPLAKVTWFPKRDGAEPEPPTTEVVDEVRTDPIIEPVAVDAPVGRRRGFAQSHRRRIDRLLAGDRRALAGLSREALDEIAVTGHSLYEQGRLPEAQRIFEALVATDPPETFAYIVLGTIYLAARDMTRALALFEAALALNPDDVAALVYRGEIRLRLGHDRRAKRDLERALELDPDGPDGPFSARARGTLRKIGD